MPIYMKYEGIDGDVTENAHTKWIDISSMQLGVGRAISTPVGSTAKRETGSPAVSEITITKQMDISSYRWLEESLYGQKAVTCTVHFLRTGPDSNLEVYVEYIFTNCLVSGYSSSTGGDTPTESISINFTKIEYKYTDRDAVNAAGGQAPRAAFDLTTAKKA